MGSHFWEATGCHQWHMCSCGFTGASVIGTISLLFRLVCKKDVQRCLQRESEQTFLAMWSPSSVPNFKEKERIADSSLVPVFLLLAQKILNSYSVDPASSSAVHHWLLWVQPRELILCSKNDPRAPSASWIKGCYFSASGFSENRLDKLPGHQICAGRSRRSPGTCCSLNTSDSSKPGDPHLAITLLRLIVQKYHPCSQRCSPCIILIAKGWKSHKFP